MTNYTKKLTNYSGTDVKHLPTFEQNMSFNQSGQLSTQQFADLIGNAAGPTTFGTRPLTGVGLLFLITYLLYRGEVGLDASAAVYIPTVFVLATYGFLPYGQGILYGTVLGIAAVVAAGVARYLT